jgi:hypothetical protein
MPTVKTLVKIHNRDLTDTKCHIKPHDLMDISADEECTVVFKNGMELPLDRGKIVTIGFDKPGTYDFDVRYKDGTLKSPGGPIIVP